MVTEQHYKDIYLAAKNKDSLSIRTILSLGLNYRDAQTYIELFHNDVEASKEVYKNSHCCICDNLLSNFHVNNCQSCFFSERMKQIRYEQKF